MMRLHGVTRLLSGVLAFGVCVAMLAAANEAKAQVVYSTYYAPAPVTTYYAPATTACYAPTTTYYAPATTAYYAAPVTSYYVPETTAYYAAPVTTYYAPAAYSAYYAPYTSYYAPYTAYYGPSVGVNVGVGVPVYYGRPRVYVPGEPVRNFFRAL